VDDLTKLLQSIREQDVMRTDIPRIEPEFVAFIMSEFLRRMSPFSIRNFISSLATTRFKDSMQLLWPEFSTNFNSYWVKRADIYENWRARNSVALPQTLNGSAAPPFPRTNQPPAYPILSPVRPVLSGAAGFGVDADGNTPAVRVLEAELVEISERLRQTRYQLDEERQKRHMLRDELEETKRQIEDERTKFIQVSRQVVVLEEDRLTHEIQVSRLRENLEQNISLKESLQLDVDRIRMQLHHAKEKYETALKSSVADNEALRRRIELLEVELSQKQSVATKKEVMEIETQNNVLRQVIEKYRRALPNSRFADSADMASVVAFEAPKLASDTEFLNSLMEALDRAKFLNKQMQSGIEPDNSWSKQSWQDLCLGWRETVCELCDLFAAAHRIANKDAPKTKPARSS